MATDGRKEAVESVVQEVRGRVADQVEDLRGWVESADAAIRGFAREKPVVALACAATPDTDGDGQANACDLDDDNDTFSDAIESYVGTNVLLACGTDAWPADINNDTFVDVIGDISVLTNNFALSVPPAPARHDIAPDPPDGFIDVIGDIARLAGLFGQSCAP